MSCADRFNMYAVCSGSGYTAFSTQTFLFWFLVIITRHRLDLFPPYLLNYNTIIRSNGP